jgi:glucose-1-phosphate adenylyltransferase
MDYRKFLQRHYETDADVTISVIPIVPDSASEFGLLKTDTDGRIVEFSEKPTGEALEKMRVDTTTLGLAAEDAAARPYLASMGIYVFKYSRLEELLSQDPSHMDFGKQVIPGAIGKYNVQGFLFDGYWEDIGTIAAFYKANLDMTTKIPPFNLFDAEAPLLSRARYLPPSKIDNCAIRDSIVSDGCIVNGATISGSVIGLRSRIGEGTQIDASYIMGADYYQTWEDMVADGVAKRPRIGIGAGSIIRHAIIDKNARIGSNVRLINEAKVMEMDGADGSYYIRDGIIIVPKNSLVADGTIV